MARIAETSKSLAADLANRIERLVAAARREGHDAALAEVRSLLAGGGGEIPVPVRRSPGRPKGSKNKTKADKPTKSGKKRKNPWAGLSAEARLARVNAIRKGRGLALKDKL